jgi:integrase
MTLGMGRKKWVWHDLPPRMKARRLASGKVLYYYQAAGKQTPLGSNLIVAKEEWARLEGGAGGTRWPQITKLYRASVFPSLAIGTRAHYKIALDNLDLTFKKATLEQIEPRHVKGYMRKRTKKGAAVFERKVGAAFFNWARGEGHTKAPNPFRDLGFGAAEKKAFASKKAPYVTDAQYAAVWARGDAVLQDAMDLALRTGQRPSDILKARRRDIIEGVLWFTQQKTGAKVGVRVKGKLAAVLERIQSRPRAVASVYLLCDRQGQRIRYQALNDRFNKARGDAEWQFRHIRTKAGADSPDLKRAQQLLGHASEMTTATHYRAMQEAVVDPLDREIQNVS